MEQGVFAQTNVPTTVSFEKGFCSFCGYEKVDQSQYDFRCGGCGILVELEERQTN